MIDYTFPGIDIKNGVWIDPYYCVCENGAVYSAIKHKWITHSVNSGYTEVRLQYPDGTVKRIKTHRLVAMTYLAPVPGKTHVNHKDGNKLNNHYSNLEWCTPAENNKHARDTGLNNVSASNSKRWKNKKFAASMIRKMKRFRKSHPNFFAGRNNPNFRYVYTLNGKDYTTKELQQKFGWTESRAFKQTRLLRERKPSVCDELGIRVKQVKSIDYRKGSTGNSMRTK